MVSDVFQGPGGTFELGGGRFEVTTTYRADPKVSTVWVRGLHWPGCCQCDGAHMPIGFGAGYFGDRFAIANRDFWIDTGVEVNVVECELNTWLEAGDLPDWITVTGR